MRMIHGRFNMYENLVIRPVEKTDLNDIEKLAKLAGNGMTNLPKNKDMLQERIERSVRSFSGKSKKSDNGLYMFVLEDIRSEKVVGCCGIFSNVGKDIPIYNFKIFREVLESVDLDIKKENMFLQLVNDYQGVTELGMLFLDKKYRKKKIGQLLSRARYFYIADNQPSFDKKVIAEMRGYRDRKGKSPFWHALGKRFIQLKFDEADIRTSNNKKHFIAELIPKTPIPVLLLDEKIQKIIGKPQKETAAAKHLLEKEGFEYNHYIDVFDGGPTMETKTEFIRTIRESHVAIVKEIKKKIKGKYYLLGNHKKQYRICLAHIEVIDDGGEVNICENTAKKLGLQPGSRVRYIKF